MIVSRPIDQVELRALCPTRTASRFRSMLPPTAKNVRYAVIAAIRQPEFIPSVPWRRPTTSANNGSNWRNLLSRSPCRDQGISKSVALDVNSSCMCGAAHAVADTNSLRVPAELAPTDIETIIRIQRKSKSPKIATPTPNSSESRKNAIGPMKSA